MKLRVELERSGPNTAGFAVPEDVVLSFGKGKRPPVTVTINGYTWRSTVAVMGGRYMLGVSSEHRAGAGVEGGQTVDVELEQDDAPRTVEPPADFAGALEADPDASRTWAALSNSNKGWHVSSIEGAKSDETRQRRIEKSVATLRAGKPR